MKGWSDLRGHSYEICQYLAGLRSRCRCSTGDGCCARVAARSRHGAGPDADLADGDGGLLRLSQGQRSSLRAVKRAGREWRIGSAGLSGRRNTLPGGDKGGSPDSNPGAGKARNQWLRHTLDASPDEPTILCCHIPLIPLREERVLSRSFGFKSYAAHDSELLETVETHSATVIAVLSGHLHLTGVVRKRDIFHIVPSGSATYP